MKKSFLRIIPVILVCIALFATAAYADAVSEPAPEGMTMDENSGRMIISEEGSYTLTGSMKGTVYVDPGEGDVELILDNVTINGGDSAGIIAASGNSLTIRLEDGSKNTIYVNGKDPEFSAAIFSKVDLTMDGTGMLEIISAGDNGVIVEDAVLTVKDGEYWITVKNQGIVMKMTEAGAEVVGGPEAEAGPEAVAGPVAGPKAEPAADPMADPEAEPEKEAGKFYLEGGIVYIDAGGEAVVPEDSVVKTDGQLVIVKRNNAPKAANAGVQPSNQSNQENGKNNQGGNNGGKNPANQPITGSTDTPGEIVYGIMENSAQDLEPDYENATKYVMSDDKNDISIKKAGTYVISGKTDNGNITVKKETTGVVLILEDLDLTSVTGAALAINKKAEVKVIISGKVTLTDNENPEDEDSPDEEVADAFEGAAIKIKADSVVCITGDGVLNVNGTAKNGIKAGDDSSLIIDGDMSINIVASNDGINGNFDVTILDGDITIDAVDDAIHADHILTIGDTDGTGPNINITKSEEGLEGTVVNILGGITNIVSTDDAVNAANKDGVYEDELYYSMNMTGGELNIRSNTDGIDSNGNINLIEGKATITSANFGGEAGIDYDGEFYLSEDFDLNNGSGVAGPDNFGPGGPGGWGGQPGGQPGGPWGGQPGGQPGGQWGGQPQGQPQGGVQAPVSGASDSSETGTAAKTPVTDDSTAVAPAPNGAGTAAPATDDATASAPPASDAGTAAPAASDTGTAAKTPVTDDSTAVAPVPNGAGTAAPTASDAGTAAPAASDAGTATPAASDTGTAANAPVADDSTAVAPAVNK